MVFIHGGSFVVGSGSFDGSYMVQAAVKEGNPFVLVTFNYRLNAFGFMALDVLSKNDERNVSGNYGVSDMVTALQWVKNNIVQFGGDPNKVTIFGHSSGGTGVLMLLSTQHARGLFHRAIAQSASTRVDMPLQDAHLQNIPFLTATKCGSSSSSSSSSTLSCLYNMSADAILAAIPWNVPPYYAHPTDMGMPSLPQGPGAMLGIVDGDIIRHTMDQILAGDFPGFFNDVPVIIGTAAQEIDFHPIDDIRNKTSYSDYAAFMTEKFQPWGPLIPGQILRYYNQTFLELGPQGAYNTIGADIHDTCGQLGLGLSMSQAFQNTIYHYIVTYRTQKPVNLFNGGWGSTFSFHMIELIFLMRMGDEWATDYTVTSQDESFGNAVRQLWTQFATHGTFSAAEWVPLMQDHNEYVSKILGSTTTTIANNWRRQECEFWNNNGFYPFNWNS
eukprot:TRINITY_DN7527_c1_g1_i1.p1 TRINITY_DN7527_c1_g1~~TRINITY_DN7527_c1_g1_i1.p1  ORF type:complete len:500 (+),score=73.90 TRINITY_DN7527_c1_g1_i1:174-1502(+)